MKRTLLAAIIGGAITLFGGAVSAQAAPLAVPKTIEADASAVQTVGYYHHRHYRRHHWYPRPVVRWHRDYYYYTPRYYGRPHHYEHRRHWTHRHHRRDYY